MVETTLNFLIKTIKRLFNIGLAIIIEILL